MKVRLIAVVGLVVLGSALALVPGTAAMAAGTCYQNPSNATCNGVSTYQAFGVSTCWGDAYAVPRGHPDQPLYIDPKTGTWYVITLYYSPHCRTNWAEADATPGPNGATFSVKVRRFAGPDGGYLMEHMPGSVTLHPGEQGKAVSPMVYSPDNTAEACLSLPPFNGDPDQIKCTGIW